MILVWGPADDAPLERVVTLLRSRSVDVVHLDDAELAALDYDVVLSPRPSGWIGVGGRQIPVDQVESMYLRPGQATDGPAGAAATTLLCLASNMSGTVVNRPIAGRSNGSKPLQLSLLAAAGLRVPETLVTTDPAAARDFLARHGRLVYKSVSGVRSIVATLGSQDRDRLDGVRTGPVQLQQWVDGLDVRVHVVGHRWFATAIDCEADDYRYASRDRQDIRMLPFAVPSELGRSIVALTHSMGLLVSGADLRLTASGDWFVFEVNPSPGFTYYEDGADQPIGAAVADLLMAVAPVRKE